MMLGEIGIFVEPGAMLVIGCGLAGVLGLVLLAVWHRLRAVEDQAMADRRALDRRITRLENAGPTKPHAKLVTPQAPAERDPVSKLNPQSKPATSIPAKPLPPSTTAAPSEEPKAPSTPAAEESLAPDLEHDDEPVGVEERLGTKVFIWVGGVAMVLAGAFLVKYSFDNALLPPAARVLIGAVFGLGLLAAGEYARRRSERIAAALTGAGVADLFGCLLAATSLYHLIGPTLGFVLMAGGTAAAVGLSLRHGRGVALLGLVGGFATPALIGSAEPAVAPLLGYLMLLQLGLTVVTRRRGWIGLTTLTLVGSMGWAGVLAVAGIDGGGQRIALEAFLIGSAAVYVLSATRFTATRSEPVIGSVLTPMRLALSAIGAAVVLMGVLVWHGRFGTMDFVMLGLTGAGVLALARLRPSYRAMAWLVGAASAATLLAWALRGAWDIQALPATRFGVTAAVFGVLYAGGCYGALWRSGREAIWAAGSAGAGAGFLLVAWVGLQLAEAAGAIPWWSIAALVGAVYAGAAVPLWRGRSRIAQGERALGALAVGSAGLFAFALWLGLDHPWQLSAWAALAAGLAWLVRRQRIAGLGLVALVLGDLTLIGLIAPGPAWIAYGRVPVLNALLPAYALPAIALGAAAWWLSGEREAAIGRALRLLALVAGGLGVLMLVRHGFHPDDVLQGRITLFEWATYAVVGLLTARGLLWWDTLWPGWPQRWVGAGLAMLGGFSAVGGACVLANPLWTPDPVGGWPIVNGLVYIYGLPAILLAWLARPIARFDDRALPAVTGAASLVLVFVLVTLEVRQGYVGSTLSDQPMSMAQWYTYSAAWIVLGIALVLAGVRWGSRSLRYASLAVMLLAIGKVFLLDTARLADLYRVVSLLGLGLSLIGLGYVYQRFVFRRRDEGRG